jgi:RNA polymerase sigma factor (sigma-70 family)
MHIQKILRITFTYSEQELVTALKLRNNGAYSYLYENYSAALYKIIKQIIQNIEEANDVLQEVFISIWRKIESYDAAKGGLFNWMLNIARNASIDMVRSKDFRNAQKNQQVSNSTDINANSPVFTQNTDKIGFQKTLDNLKQEHRILIELSYFKGYTHEEIAWIAGIPLGTVKSRLRNALLQLRQYWDNESERLGTQRQKPAHCNTLHV